MFDKVGIIGLGLIGGSLAKAVRYRLGIQNIVAMNRHEDVLLSAYEEGVISAYTTEIDSLFIGCDIIFICTPVSTIYNYAEQLTAYVDKSCIITDVGSTKGCLYTEMESLAHQLCYIGGHPMTGAEKSRYEASKEHLFENAYYIVAPEDSVPIEKIEEFRSLINAIGAIPIVVAPMMHDKIVAAISHVPHIVASALVQTVKSLDTAEGHMHTLAAGGFKDITRIASGSPDMWENICRENREEICKVITSFQTILDRVKENISSYDKNQVFSFFQEAKDYRDSFTNTTPGLFVKSYEITVDVVDKPGSISVIAALFTANHINIKNLQILNSREHENGALLLSFASEEQQSKSAALLRSMNYAVTIKE